VWTMPWRQRPSRWCQRQLATARQHCWRPDGPAVKRSPGELPGSRSIEPTRIPSRFWAYLLEALGRVDERLVAHALPLVRASPGAPVDAIAATLVNDLTRNAEPVCFGTASLAIPQAAASSLGTELTSFDVFAARTVGMIDWWSKQSAGSTPRRTHLCEPGYERGPCDPRHVEPSQRDDRTIQLVRYCVPRVIHRWICLLSVAARQPGEEIDNLRLRRGREQHSGG
jgi:hypothetical protein